MSEIENNESATQGVEEGHLNLFQYLDYRRFLADFYKIKKKKKPRFSYRTFARLAGFSSSSYIHHVIQGKRDVSNNALEGFCRALGLKTREKIYFENLVRFNQALHPEARNRYYEMLLPIHKKESGLKLRVDQYRFYSKWYGPVMREMVMLTDFRESPQWIRRRLNNHITVGETREMIDLLLELGLIERKEKRLIVTNKNLTTSAEVREMAVIPFHHNMLNRAKRSLEEDPPETREISCITAALSREQFVQIKEMIQEFHNRVMERIDQWDGRGDEVYQFNCQLFSITRNRGKNHVL